MVNCCRKSDGNWLKKLTSSHHHIYLDGLFCFLVVFLTGVLAGSLGWDDFDWREQRHERAFPYVTHDVTGGKFSSKKRSHHRPTFISRSLSALPVMAFIEPETR